jgi:hypothetical protein
MSDISTDPVVEAAPPAAPVADAAPEADLFDNAETTTFPREYVEKLRRENAEVRTKFAPFRDAFEGVEDDLKDYVLNDIVRPLLNDPQTALDELYGIVERIHAAGGTEPKWLTKEIAKAEAADPNAPLTLAQLEAREKAKADADKQAEGLRQIWAETTELGYPSAPADDPYGDLASLFAISTNHTKGDLKKAHAIREARLESIVKERVDAKLEEIRTGALKWPAVSTTGTSPAEEKQEPKTFAEARQRAKARMDNIFKD